MKRRFPWIVLCRDHVPSKIFFFATGAAAVSLICTGFVLTHSGLLAALGFAMWPTFIAALVIQNGKTRILLKIADVQKESVALQRQTIETHQESIRLWASCAVGGNA